MPGSPTALEVGSIRHPGQKDLLPISFLLFPELSNACLQHYNKLGRSIYQRATGYVEIPQHNLWKLQWVFSVLDYSTPP